MRTYELTLIVDPDLTSENQKKLLAKIKKLIEELEGKVEKTNEWGKKEFTYPIKKKNLGYYFFWELILPSGAVSELDGKLKLEEEIIRYLLVRKEGK